MRISKEKQTKNTTKLTTVTKFNEEQPNKFRNYTKFDDIGSTNQKKEKKQQQQTL